MCNCESLNMIIYEGIVRILLKATKMEYKLSKWSRTFWIRELSRNTWPGNLIVQYFMIDWWMPPLRYHLAVNAPGVRMFFNKINSPYIEFNSIHGIRLCIYVCMRTRKTWISNGHFPVSTWIPNGTISLISMVIPPFELDCTHAV